MGSCGQGRLPADGVLGDPAVVAGGVSVLTMVVLALGLYEPVVFGDTPAPSAEAIEAGVPVAE